jgi:D-alanyl-D-alanine carboxypeptidase
MLLSQQNLMPQNSMTEDYQELDAYITKQTEETEFSGVVLIANEGVPQFSKAYGLASKEYKIPNNLNTKFNIGSINKLFTSVAIAQLLQKGKLQLDDTIGKYLSGFSAEASEKISIRNLLQMQAGWGDYWNNDNYKRQKHWIRDVSGYIAFLRDEPIQFKPGTQTQHCNTCFEVLGAVIEKVSGLNYYDYIRKNIYMPAKMNCSDSFERDFPLENRAQGYTRLSLTGGAPTKEYERNNIFILPARGTPAGGGYSTANDLLRFTDALLKNKLLNQSYTTLLIKHFDMTVEEALLKDRPIKWLGGAPGVGAYIAIMLKSQQVVIVLTNYDYTASDSIGDRIVGIIGK